MSDMRNVRNVWNVRQGIGDTSPARSVRSRCYSWLRHTLANGGIQAIYLWFQRHIHSDLALVSKYTPAQPSLRSPNTLRENQGERVSPLGKGGLRGVIQSFEQYWQWFDHWIHPWITRANGTYALGCLLLLQGIKNEWYHLPPEAVDTFHSSQFWIQDAPRAGAAVFVGGLSLWLLGFLGQWVRSKLRQLTPARPSPYQGEGVPEVSPLGIRVACSKNTGGLRGGPIIPRLPYWGGLLIILLFPFLLTVGAPTITYLATAYNDQNLEVVRHVEKKFPEVQAQWKQNVSFDQTRPVTSVFTFNIDDRTFFQLSSWERVVLDGFGYRNPVFDFIGKGWGMSVAGMVLSLIGIYMQHRHQALQIFHKDMGIFIPVAGVILGAIVVYLIGINLARHQIMTEMGRGDYGAVVTHSEQLARLHPPLRGDEDFVRRWATASVYGDRPNPALIAFAQGGDRYRAGDFFNAKSYFESALDLDPELFLARGYLATTWINEGVEYSKFTDRPELPVYTVSFPKKNNFLDSAQSNERPNVLRIAGAIERFEKGLEIFPNHIAGLYDLMLAHVMNGDFESSAQVAKTHIAVQSYFQKSNVALLGQAYLHQSWADYHDEDLDVAWRRYRQSRDSKAWGEEVEE